MTRDDLVRGHRVRRTVGDISYTVFEPADPAPARVDTVLLLHGWPGTSADWDTVVSAMQPCSSRLVVPDLRGFGLSLVDDADPDDPPTPREHLRDLAAVLDDVDAGRTVVGGYDLGATLAQQLAFDDERVVALVLGAPPYAGIGDRRFEPAVQQQLWYQHFHQLPWAADLVAHDEETTRIYLQHFYTHWWGEGCVDADHFVQVVKSYARPGAFEQSIGWYRARQRQRAVDQAKTHSTGVYAAPAVVLWGLADPVNPARFADRLPEFFTDLRLELLPGKGHFLPLESPSAFAAALTQTCASTA